MAVLGGAEMAQTIDWKEKAGEVVAKYGARSDALLLILHELQAETNYLPEEALREVALALDIPLAKVYGVVTFYSMYSVKPRGKYVIRICESAPCHIMGAQDVIAAMEEALGIKMGETTKDGLFTLEFTSCLGVCGVAPAVMINDTVHGNLTPEAVKAILAEYREKQGGRSA